MWDYLAKPFKPGMVIPYQSGWAFTFEDATGQDYTNRNVTYKSAWLAKTSMRQFVEYQNSTVKED